MTTTPHDKALAAACKATILGEDEDYKPIHLELREAETAIAAYLSSIGGVVCAKTPVAIGVQRMGEIVGFIPGGDVDAEYILPEDNLPRVPLHAPLPIAGKGDDGWADMSSAPKDGTDILAWHPHWRDPEIVAWNSGEQAWCNGSWCWNDAPTHWRSLPAPPSLLSEDTEGGV
ncbi:hypothetical protein G6M02_07840 [Agrobacterium rhizogenes]|nr:hypothetical protein [Rhizobium rhizogenes]